MQNRKQILRRVCKQCHRPNKISNFFPKGERKGKKLYSTICKVCSLRLIKNKEKNAK